MYDPDVFDILVKLINILHQSKIDILLFATIRNSETYNKFIKECEKYKLELIEEECDVSNRKYFPYLCLISEYRFKKILIKK